MTEAAPQSTLYVGVMSGTSLDGVDAVLVDFAQERLDVDIRHIHQPFPGPVRRDLRALASPGTDEIARTRDAGNALATLYASAVKDLLQAYGTRPDQVAAIGCHGQTVRHAPERGWTAQIGNPHLLAELSGIDVVHDFRGRDVARGGQGAPLAPLFHARVFAEKGRTVAVANIGGIANTTMLPADGGAPRAHDTGPGNVLMDEWAGKCTGKRFDRDGEWALSGNVVEELKERMLADPYFSRPPPKSTGRELFNLGWLEALDPGRFRPEDVQATLLELTAHTVAESVRADKGAGKAVLCGGGALNRALVQRIAGLLPGVEVVTSGAAGFPETWVEGATFAYLAMMRMTGRRIDTSGLTGSAPGGHLAGLVARH